MTQEIKTIELSDQEIDIRTNLRWIEEQQIQGVLNSGMKLTSAGVNGFDGEAVLNSRIKAMELLIVDIRKDGKSQKFSRAWLETLSVQDGNKIVEEIDKITQPPKE